MNALDDASCDDVVSLQIRTMLVMDWLPRNRIIEDALAEHDRLSIVGRAWSLERVTWLLNTSGVELAFVDTELVLLDPADVCGLLKRRLLAPKVILMLGGPYHAPPARNFGFDATIHKSTLREFLPGKLGRLFPTVTKGAAG